MSKYCEMGELEGTDDADGLIPSQAWASWAFWTMLAVRPELDD